MTQHILNEIFHLVSYDGIQQKKWEQCRDLDSQLQFIRDAIPLRLNELIKNEDYEALEKQVQKYENEIRKHIRMEQQIKLYAESLQQKLEDIGNNNDLLSSLKQLTNSLKKENIQLQEQVKKLQTENSTLRLKLADFNEIYNGNQTSPSCDKQKEYLQQKSNSKYSTIDGQIQKSRRYTKIQDDNVKGICDIKTQINNTIDSSMMKMLQNRRDSIKYDGSYKSSRDNTIILEKGDSTRIKSNNYVQSRTLSQQQKQTAYNNDYNFNQAKTTECARVELKNQKLTDNYKHFLNTYNVLCSKSKTNSRQDNRQRKSTSDHNDKQKDFSIFLKHDYQKRSNTRQQERIRYSQDYYQYLENDI